VQSGDVRRPTPELASSMLASNTKPEQRICHGRSVP
jgi:hypothetical protein